MSVILSSVYTHEWKCIVCLYGILWVYHLKRLLHLAHHGKLCMYTMNMHVHKSS